MISKPFMSPAQPRDLPRVRLVQQYDTFVEPDVHQQPMAAVAPDEAGADVHHLGHAVVIYFFWYFVFFFFFFSFRWNASFCGDFFQFLSNNEC